MSRWKRDPEVPPVVVFWTKVCARYKIPVIYTTIPLPDFQNKPVKVNFRLVQN